MPGSQSHKQGKPAPTDYEPWLRALFPRYWCDELGQTVPFADRHHEFWRHVWAIEKGARPKPVVAIWGRGGGKSTNAEAAVIAVGARKARNYCLYISGTQEQADAHVASIASMLEGDEIARFYPLMAERAIGKYGNSRGWRRNRLRTAHGFTVDALGLDVAARGVKIDHQRPDLIVLDDVDDTEDSPETTEKKIRAITHKILPAGSSDCATVAVQNVVHYESIFARLANIATTPADFLADRVVLGPYPAVVGLKVERGVDGRYEIVAGTPTWEGQGLAICAEQINEWGLKAFLSEAQHERVPPEGQAFPEFDPSVHVVDDFTIPESWPRWRAVDYGYAVPYCCLWLARRHDGTIFVYREDYATGLVASQQATRVRMLSAGERFFASVGDPAMWAEKREGQLFKPVSRQYAENGVRLTKATNNRISGWARVHELLEWRADPVTKAMAAPPRLYILRRCANLIRTLPLMVKDPNHPEDIDTTLEDHAADSLRYALQAAHWLGANKPKTRTMSVGGTTKKHPLDGWVAGGVWTRDGGEAA